MHPKLHIVIIAAFCAIASALVAVSLVLSMTENYQNVINTDIISSTDTVSSDIPEIADNGIRLLISTPETQTLNLTEPNYTFKGTADPDEPLYLNGEIINIDRNGSFTIDVNLNIGSNYFLFEHKGESFTYTLNYRYVIINYYHPSVKQTYSCGSTFSVTVTARNGSTVTAHFNEQTIYLEPMYSSEEFISYNGNFSLPSNNLCDINLGKITYTANFDGKSESFKSADIICLKPDIIVNYDPDATPLGGKYVNVGSGKIAEIIDYQAETFDAKSTDNYSRPTNNYLPKGTIDYSAQEYYYYDNTTKYALLRCGYQVYTDRRDKPGNEKIQVIKEYVGTLPDHNEVGIASFNDVGKHTVMTLDVDWKAPFYFDILPQEYTNTARQDYSISQVTYNYIDITFCYATVFKSELPDLTSNPLFSSCQLIQNEYDCTLRLYLRKQGGFYGWDSYYNSDNRLVFEFLNPAKVSPADNTYGTSLEGVSILIDVGHGGIDPGAIGFNDRNHTEAIQNLELACYIKTELESIGATVYMTRTSNITSTTDDKMIMIENIKPDFCIAIHHNGNNASYVNGYETTYFNAFSKKAAEYINNHISNTGIYNTCKLKWHYYFMCRSTACPVVLTENGYITNWNDYSKIVDPTTNINKAVAITKGIVEYFNSIQ